MSSFVKVAFVFPLLLAACRVDQSRPSPAETKAGALGAPSVSTDHPSYQTGSTITVSYAGLPGNYHDWIAIAPAGSPYTASWRSSSRSVRPAAPPLSLPRPTALTWRARSPTTTKYCSRESASFTVNLGDDLDGSVQLQQRFHHHRLVRGVARQPPRLDRDRTGRFPQHHPPGVRLHVRSDQRHRHFRGPGRRLLRGARVRQRRLNTARRERAVHRHAAPTGPTISTDQSSYSQRCHHHRLVRGVARQQPRLDRDRTGRFPQHHRPGVRLHERSDQRHRHFLCPGRRLLRGARVRQRRLNPARRERVVHRHRGADPATISTDQSSYNSGSTITVTYAGLPGNNHDWIAIAPAGSPNTTSWRSSSRTVRPAAPPRSLPRPAALTWRARSPTTTKYCSRRARRSPSSRAGDGDDLDGSVQLQQRFHHHRLVRGVARQQPRLDRDRTGRFALHHPPGVCLHVTVRPAAPPRSLPRPPALTWRARSPTTTKYCSPRARRSPSPRRPGRRSRRISPATPAVPPSPSRTRGCPATTTTGSRSHRPVRPNTSVSAFVFTYGQTSGTATFSAPAAGSYVARAFANDD